MFFSMNSTAVMISMQISIWLFHDDIHGNVEPTMHNKYCITEYIDMRHWYLSYYFCIKGLSTYGLHLRIVFQINMLYFPGCYKTVTSETTLKTACDVHLFK